MTTGAANGFVLTSDASGVGTWQAASGGANGWADDGAVVRLTTGSDAVGIGTATPTKKLEVAGSIKVGTNDTIFSSNISSNSPLRLQTAGTTRMYIDDASGNVGIGATTPGEKLELAGSVYVNAEGAGLIVDAGGIKRVGLIKQGGFAGELRYLSSTDLSVRRVTTGTLVSPTASDIPLTFDGPTGNVGIGTISPVSLLELKSTSGPELSISRADVGRTVRLGLANAEGGLRVTAGTITAEGAQLAFSVRNGSGVDLASVLGNGNVGIGTTSPQSKLQIVGGYLQLPTLVGFGPPPASDCDEAAEAGRMIVAIPGSGIEWMLWICRGTDGWYGK